MKDEGGFKLGGGGRRTLRSHLRVRLRNRNFSQNAQHLDNNSLKYR